MDHSLEDRDSPNIMEATRQTVSHSDCTSAVAPATRTPCDQALRYSYRVVRQEDEGRTDDSAGAGAHPSRRRRRTARTSGSSTAGPSRMGLAFLMCQLLAPRRATADVGRALQREECSCSPREFGFRLSLSSACPPLPPPFPPNAYFGAGVKDYTCSIAPEPVQDRDEELAVADKIAMIQNEAQLDQSTSRTSSWTLSFKKKDEEDEEGDWFQSMEEKFHKLTNKLPGGGVRG